MQLQPLHGETLGERLRLVVGEHPPDLFLEFHRVRQLARVGQLEELVVGHRTPQEVAEAHREFVVVHRDARRLAGGSALLFDAIEELRRDEHRLEHRPDTVLE